MRLNPAEQEYLDRLHLMLYHHLRQPDGSSQVTLHLVSAFLWYVDHLWNRHEQSYREHQSREQRLFTDFIQLVSEYAPEHHTIDFYASRLCITPRYMSTIIKQVSGKSAKQWIDAALVTRIKIDLKHTDKSIARIEQAILDTLSATPPELAADIYRTGIYLAGGGSLLRGLDQRISSKTKLQVHIAEDPLRAVARGTGIALKNFSKFSFLIR
jgi:AraC-like DNA-binding protein